MLQGIEQIEGLTPEQMEQINNLAGGLANKNQELLEKLSAKKDQGTASAAELEQLRQFKAQAERQAAEDQKNWKEAERLLKESHQKDLEKMQQQLQQHETTVRTLLIDNGLADALDSVGINPALKAGAVAMLHGQAEIVEGQAMIGDKPLSDAVKEWAESDIGKAYTLAPENNGTGSNGGSANVDTNKRFSDYTAAELVNIKNTAPEEYQRLLETR